MLLIAAFVLLKILERFPMLKDLGIDMECGQNEGFHRYRLINQSN